MVQKPLELVYRKNLENFGDVGFRLRTDENSLGDNSVEKTKARTVRETQAGKVMLMKFQTAKNSTEN